MQNSQSQVYGIEKSNFGFECTRDYDRVLAIIGRNRKLLLKAFKNEHKKSGFVSFIHAKEILNGVLEQNNIRLSDKNWAKILKFSEKNGIVDYEFMLDVFK